MADFLNSTFSGQSLSRGQRRSWPLLFGAWGLLAARLASSFLGDTDQGYIMGIAWRIFQGQELYTEVDYVRPPLSPWLHSLWFFFGDAWLWLSRFAMVAMIGLAVWWQRGFLANQGSPFSQEGIWWLAAALMSLHNFPAMPWHTIDGVFFGSLGWWCLANKYHVRSLAFPGGAAFACAALAKQSFFFLPLFALAWLLLLPDQRNKLPWFLAGGLFTGAFALIALLPDPAVAWSWVMGSSSGGDVWEAGVKAYVLPLIPALAIILARLSLKRWRPSFPDIVYPAAVLLVLAAWSAMMIRAGSSASVPWKAGQVLWWVGLWEAVQSLRRKEPGAAAWLALLGLAWCSSLSWGYATPVLVALPLIIPALKAGKWPRLALAAGALMVVLTGWFYPYREQRPADLLSAELISRYPALGLVKVGPEIAGELQELDSLRQAWPGTFTVLPNWPHIHALTGTTNPLPSDWEHNAEMQFDQNPTRYRQALANTDYIFLDKDQLGEAGQAGRYGSQIMAEVLKNWTKAGETRHWVWLKRPDKPAAENPEEDN